MVFYRKYRPQFIEELDSLDIREKLYSVLSSSSVPHAFLFTGPKGLGKTSTARIVAKAINCEKVSRVSRVPQVSQGEKTRGTRGTRATCDTPENIEPCNACVQCASITNGTNMDVLEIDAASNRGIDEIRDLRDKIRLAPISANKKVYIIDEVHMLTTEAFNALLKTLEEPPPHAVFILCTTEMHKLPETILSRCVHVAFKKATDEELSRSFKRIAKSEKVEIEEEALKFIASLSDGSFRDGVKVLEELVSLSKGGKITKELIENKYQISNIKSQISKMLEALVEKNTKEALVLISKLVEQGVDIKYFMEQLINQLHKELLDQVGVTTSDGTDEGVRLLDKRGGRLSPPAGGGSHDSSEVKEIDLQDIKKLIELLSKAHGELKYAVLPQLPLELAVIEWGEELRDCLPHVTEDAQQSFSNNSTTTPSLNERRHPKINNLETDAKSAFSSSVSGQAISNDNNDKSRSASISGKKVSQGSTSDGDPKGLLRGEGIGDGNHQDLWKKIIDGVKQQNHSIAGVLRGCSLKNFDKKTLIIEASYKFHKEKLEERKSLEIIEKVVEEIVGQKVVVSIILKTSN